MSEEKPVVFYDGACPVCSREISFYQRQQGAEDIDWVDVTQSDNNFVAPGLSREAALRRFHMRQADGTLIGGVNAFAELWTHLPRFRIAGRIARLPVISTVLEWGYISFLAVRKRFWRKAREQGAHRPIG
jgi:predicted DCC family thiol-disulfide oxidoreductase YuxK